MLRSIAFGTALLLLAPAAPCAIAAGLPVDARPASPALLVAMGDDRPCNGSSTGNQQRGQEPRPDEAKPAISAPPAPVVVPRPTVAELTEKLKDDDARVRKYAVNQLARIRPAAPEATATMLPLLKDQNAGVRIAVIYSLAAMHADPKQAVPEMAKLVADDDDGVRSALADALHGMGSEAVPALTELLEDKKPEIRARAAQSLGEIGPDAKGATAALERHLTDMAKTHFGSRGWLICHHAAMALYEILGEDRYQEGLPPVHGNEHWAYKGARYYIDTAKSTDGFSGYLGVTDGGELAFQSRFDGSSFQRAGARLRIYVGKERSREKTVLNPDGRTVTRFERLATPAAVLEKEGLYLTGDYSGVTPRVILTKEPTKYSRWTVIRVEHDRFKDPVLHQTAYLKNDNDLGKDVWLDVEARGPDGKVGQKTRRPILSFEKRMPFVLQNTRDGL